MKTTGLSLIITVCLAAVAWAQSPNRDDSRNQRPDDRRVTRSVERGAYLGVSAAPLPPALQHQLGLPAGMGLVVEFVQEKSPAADAGLHQYDVLQKLDDQLLINPQQLAVLVRSYKPGDQIKLTIIRDGKKQELTAKLSEHELVPLRSLQPLEWDLDGSALPPPPVRSFPLNPQFAKPHRFGTDVNNQTLTWLEGDRNYTIVTRDGHRTITVSDRNNEAVFEGPIDTLEQRDRLPADIKDKVQKMIRSGLLAPEMDESSPKPGESKPAPAQPGVGSSTSE
ncbi:MAG TPA: PDZ domain-containing protein [Humisphaera sp.]|jgi:hypothetical protein|nr:PDZ domain-containing protein [Humisphaera sp.]